jgi:hypothetical protein
MVKRAEREWTFGPTSEEGKPKRKDEKFQERQGSHPRAASDGEHVRYGPTDPARTPETTQRVRR